MRALEDFSLLPSLMPVHCNQYNILHDKMLCAFLNVWAEIYRQKRWWWLRYAGSSLPGGNRGILMIDKMSLFITNGETLMEQKIESCSWLAWGSYIMAMNSPKLVKHSSTKSYNHKHAQIPLSLKWINANRFFSSEEIVGKKPKTHHQAGTAEQDQLPGAGHIDSRDHLIGQRQSQYGMTHQKI